MDIPETIKRMDYLMLGNNLIVKSVIDIGSSKKYGLAITVQWVDGFCWLVGYL